MEMSGGIKTYIQITIPKGQQPFNSLKTYGVQPKFQRILILKFLTASLKVYYWTDRRLEHVMKRPNKSYKPSWIFPEHILDIIINIDLWNRTEKDKIVITRILKWNYIGYPLRKNIKITYIKKKEGTRRKWRRIMIKEVSDSSAKSLLLRQLLPKGEGEYRNTKRRKRSQ